MMAAAIPSGLDEHRRQGRRNDVAPENACRSRAHGPRGQYILELSRPEHLPPHQSCVANPANHGQGQQDVGETRPEHGNQRDRQQEAGEREQRIDHPADHIVEQSTEVAGQRAEHRADSGRNQYHRQADEERDAGAREHAGQNVSAQFVKPEGMGQRRAIESQREFLRGGVVGRQQRAGCRGQGKQRDDHQTDLQH
jgi:hypothetical protein